jgi:hypothetical protein
VRNWRFTYNGVDYDDRGDFCDSRSITFNTHGRDDLVAVSSYSVSRPIVS